MLYDLFLEALLRGLTVRLDGQYLRVRGPASAAHVAERVREESAEVFVALQHAAQLLRQIRDAGLAIKARDVATIVLSPATPDSVREAVADTMPALLMLLRSESRTASTSPPAATPACTQSRTAGPEAANTPPGGVADADDWPPPLAIPENFAAEHRFERALLRQRYRHCQDAAVKQTLNTLIEEPAPGTEAEWLSQGRRWREIEHDLRQAGRLPQVPAVVAKQAA